MSFYNYSVVSFCLIDNMFLKNIHNIIIAGEIFSLIDSRLFLFNKK